MTKNEDLMTGILCCLECSSFNHTHCVSSLVVTLGRGTILFSSRITSSGFLLASQRHWSKGGQLYGHYGV